MEIIRKRAKEVGLSDVENMEKGDCIRAIQQMEGNEACFDASWCNQCTREECAWRKDCRSVGISF